MLILTVVFTLENAYIIKVNYFFWSAEASLSLVLFITLAIGLLSAIIVLLPIIISLKAAKNDLTREIIEIQEQMAKKILPIKD